MKIIHIKKHGCHKYVAENDFFSKWKSLGFKIVEDTVNSVSSINLPIDASQVDFENMEWLKLKKYATEKGIKTHKKSKPEIIKSLKELEG